MTKLQRENVESNTSSLSGRSSPPPLSPSQMEQFAATYSRATARQVKAPKMSHEKIEGDTHRFDRAGVGVERGLFLELLVRKIHCMQGMQK